MKRATIRLVSLFAVVVISISRATGQGGFIMGHHTYRGTTFQYFLFVPANLDPPSRYPLVLCLHGGLGDKYTPSDMVKLFGAVFADSAKQAKAPSFVLLPIDLYMSLKVLAVNDLLDTLLGKYPVDRGRLYLTGMSLGGGNTWELLGLYPNKFAAAVPICATGADTSKASRLKQVPLWVFHGALDITTYASVSRNMIAALEHAGATPVYTEGLPDSIVEDRIMSGATLLYTEYPDGTHYIWNRVYAEPLLLPWLFRQTITDVEEHPHNAVPREHILHQNYPNPFNPTTTIRYSLPHRSHVVLTVFNTLGQQVAELVDSNIDAGSHELLFNAGGLASGVYFYPLEAGDFRQTRAMLLLR